MLPAAQGGVGAASEKVAHNGPVQGVGAFGQGQQDYEKAQLPDLPALGEQRGHGQGAGYHAQGAQFAAVDFVAQPAHAGIEKHIGYGKSAHEAGGNDGVLLAQFGVGRHRRAGGQEPDHQGRHEEGGAGVDDVAKAGGHYQEPVGGRAHCLAGGEVGFAELRAAAPGRSGEPAGGGVGRRRRFGGVAVGQQAHILRGAAQEPGQGYYHRQDGDAQRYAGAPPADGEDQQADQGRRGAAQAVAHADYRHRQAAPPPEPVVHRRDGRVVVARPEAHGQEADKDDQKVPVAAGVAQQDEAEAGHQAAEGQHYAGAEAVGAVAHQGALEAAHHPAQALGQPHHGAGEAQILLHRDVEHGEAPVESAVFHPVGDEADEDDPPAVKDFGASGRLRRGWWHRLRFQ